MSERSVTRDQVRAEHLAEVEEHHHWIYLAVVILGGTALMLGFIAFLGSAA